MSRDLLKSLRDEPIDQRKASEVKRLIAEFESARCAFKALVETSPEERYLQSFLERNPLILLHAALDGFYPVASWRSALFSKVRLGSDFEVDFLYCSLNSLGAYWTFIELERPDAVMFNRKGDPSSGLSHAIRQVYDWQAWVTDNRAYAEKKLEALAGDFLKGYGWDGAFRRRAKSLIVIGRRSQLTTSSNRLRGQLCDANPDLEIISYDRLFDSYSTDKEEDLDLGKDEVRLIRRLGKAGI